MTEVKVSSCLSLPKHTLLNNLWDTLTAIFFVFFSICQCDCQSFISFAFVFKIVFVILFVFRCVVSHNKDDKIGTLNCEEHETRDW